MPQSITIAAFVFGAVLLLIAIIGGRFKIFGAEIPEVAGRKVRIVAAVAGVVFIAIGLYGSFPSKAPHRDSSKKEPYKPVPAAVPTPPTPAPPTKVLKGYLIVNKNSNIDRIENLRKNDRICATKASAEFLRSSPTFSQYDIQVVPAPEIYEALQKGFCVATFALDRGAADKLFPVGLTQMHLIPFYE
jgi:hypothetical protein